MYFSLETDTDHSPSANTHFTATIYLFLASSDTRWMSYQMQRLASSAIFVSLLALGACSPAAKWNGSLEALLLAQPGRFGTVMQDPNMHRVQIIYTQIDRDENNLPSFTSFDYRLNADEYFYPASTVKLPTALLALEKINSIEAVNRDTAMLTDATTDWQLAVIEDASAPKGVPSVGHYIRKILLVSDNDAFNRLYEFLGQEPLNDSLQEKGFGDTRILHRLEIPLSVEQNRLTNPVRFISEGEIVYGQGPQYSSQSLVAGNPVLLGKAEIVGDELLSRPKDFAEKNAFPLQDLHDVIKSLMFPESVDANRRFGLTDDDYQFVYENMSSYPGDSGIEDYRNAEDYPDGYVKFLMYGGDAERIPENIRIFNKVGDAYGFLIDAAYIIDLENNLEFILAATVYTNANEIFNDNNYEYDEIGQPFLRELGQAIHEVELRRNRANPPDLARFR